MTAKKLYAGQLKVSRDIEKRVKAEKAKDTTKADKTKKMYYYLKLTNKNKSK